MSSQPVPVPFRSTFRGSSLYLGAFIALGCSTLLLGPSLDTFRERTGVGKDAIGVLFTYGAIGYLIGSLLGRSLLDRVKAHRILGVGLLLMAASLVGVAYAQTLLWLGITQAILGLGAAMLDTTGNTVVLWMFHGGPVMNALHMCFALGGAIAPGIVAWSSRSTGDIRWSYFGVALVLGIGAIAALGRPSPKSPHTENGGTLPRRLYPLLATGMLFFFVYVGVELGFLGWINDYAIARGLTKNGGATALNTAFLVSFTVGRIVGVPVSTRLKPHLVLAADLVLCAVGLATLLIGADSRPALWFGTLLFGFGTASMFPTMLLLIEPHLPSTGAVTSSFLIGASGGSMVLPWLIGKRFDSAGANAMPATVLMGVVGCAVVVAAFMAIARRLGTQQQFAKRVRPAPS